MLASIFSCKRYRILISGQFLTNLGWDFIEHGLKCKPPIIGVRLLFNIQSIIYFMKKTLKLPKKIYLFDVFPEGAIFC